ncbi:Putative sodium sulfate symporter [Gryllus bimaculatus]|nr:Putative sodium sulfate symporter [Gryllus bimaculatus]
MADTPGPPEGEGAETDGAGGGRRAHFQTEGDVEQSPNGVVKISSPRQDPTSNEDISLSMSFRSSCTKFSDLQTSTERGNQRVVASSRNAPLSPVPEDLPLGDHTDTGEGTRKRSGWKQYLKITLLAIVWAIFTNVSDAWIIPLVSSKDLIDFVPEVTTTKRFLFKGINFTCKDPEVLVARIQMSTNMEASFPVALSYDLTPIDTYKGQIYGGVVLFGLYGLIITETVHRALAAIVASTMSVAILAAMNERPTMHELVSWIDIETLLLLFSMMVLVAILAETGIFDSLAVYAYQITNGRVWPLVNTLCLFTAALSSFLDNVTTVLLMTPVTIRLCEVTELNPIPILMSMTMFSNIGGALTPVGDPPNAIIASHPDIIAAGIDFGVFTLHMGVGVFLALISINIFLRLKFKNISDLRFTEPQDIQELRHEIAIWKRAAASLSTYSKDEDIVRRTLLLRVRRLTTDLKRKLNNTYKATLEELKAKYPIRDKVLLIKSGLALFFVILLFFLHSVPQLKLSLGWTALLGAILLLLLTADNEIMESVLNRIEWGTLLFFAALFVLMEALSRLGLIDLVGSLTERFVLSLPVNARLSGSIIFILVISAIASSFVDNIPLTTMMIRIVTSLAQNTDINLPLQPLVWALAFGACLGGNGTLIGSSANMVCAGVAEQHGYKFTFIQYFKLGFPVTTISVIGAGIYLLIAHVVFTWHDQ